jgi:hypothetical protein
LSSCKIRASCKKISTLLPVVLSHLFSIFNNQFIKKKRMLKKFKKEKEKMNGHCLKQSSSYTKI